ncbi:MAG: ferredoxin reductase family protein [Nocardioides sp.]
MSTFRSSVWSRHLGPVTIGALTAAYVVLWVALQPAEEPTAGYLGELVGAVSVLLLSMALVLISTLPLVEDWFDGIDRAAIWHRRLAIAGLLLLALHIPFAASPDDTPPGKTLGAVGAWGLVALALWAILPRWQSVVPRPVRGWVRALRDVPVVHQVRSLLGGYDRWRELHRTTGLFVGAAFLHGVLDGSMFDESQVLRWSYLVPGAVGLAFYVYRELLSRWFRSLHDYQVDQVADVGDGVVEIVLRPLGRPVIFVPGQFALVYIEAKDGWHRHPFTIASTPTDPRLRVTVKALGDYTSRLRELLEPGMPAVVGGPHGRFSHAKGGRHQVWIAGGVGVAPFLSWMRALDHHPVPGGVDFYYAFSGGPAPFADELVAIAQGRDDVRTHLVDSQVTGRLTVERVLADAGVEASQLSVFLCGPEPMLRDFQRGLRVAGVRGSRIHREYFDWR